MELDHFFILVEAGGADAAEALRALGFHESSGNRHAGQGTANRRFVFSNSKLELLWVEDNTEALQGPGRELYLHERTTNDSASPFGFIFRPKKNAEAGQPFCGWRYQPDFFKAPMAFWVGSNSSILTEPCCIYAPFFKPRTFAPDGGHNQSNEYRESKAQKPLQPSHFDWVSDICVTVPMIGLEAGEYSDVLRTVSLVEGLSIKMGADHLIALTFNHHKCGQAHDFRPLLPLVIYW